MTTGGKMLEETKTISFRGPVELVAYLEKKADEARRSLSSEIVFRLERSRTTEKPAGK
jgi:hypothetical protein